MYRLSNTNTSSGQWLDSNITGFDSAVYSHNQVECQDRTDTMIIKSDPLFLPNPNYKSESIPTPLPGVGSFLTLNPVLESHPKVNKYDARSNMMEFDYSLQNVSPMKQYPHSYSTQLCQSASNFSDSTNSDKLYGHVTNLDQVFIKPEGFSESPNSMFNHKRNTSYTSPLNFCSRTLKPLDSTDSSLVLVNGLFPTFSGPGNYDLEQGSGGGSGSGGGLDLDQVFSAIVNQNSNSEFIETCQTSTDGVIVDPYSHSLVESGDKRNSLFNYGSLSSDENTNQVVDIIRKLC